MPTVQTVIEAAKAGALDAAMKATLAAHKRTASLRNVFSLPRLSRAAEP